MRLLLDMNLAPRWCEYLAGAGYDARHWSTLGGRGAPDSEIMAYAREHGFVVITHDLDFGAILAATGGLKPSVVLIRADDTSPEAIGARVVAALLQMAAELDAGALVTVEPSRSRLRLLPLLSRRGDEP